ncbi:glycerophosphodiester phosphodiesterase [Acinetobacter pseudolwoffii]|uniref:Glycerophosphodiester phosphodiesterase n=1 Tax=Acinetobacter pseudolwoffii TaxID=2053287 RepID=A0A2H9UMG6_9GAMM|nr:glycerophosphodiester phosphodiesterase [Acinetobacter pseudolwoffii]PJI32902.1 glycerophosphodiester phosphodiesterase [Acinetobacter pseudolwoffii]
MRIIGHRGARGEAPENTLGGFQYIQEIGIRAVEFDVRQLKDNALIIMHDDDFVRTTGLQKHLYECNRQDLTQYNHAVAWSEWNKIEATPLLDQTLNVIRNFEHIEVEIKSVASEEAAEKIAFEVEQQLQGYEQAAIITSFDAKILDALQQQNSRLKRGLLIETDVKHQAIDRALELGCCHIGWMDELASKDLIQATQAAELNISVWTVNDVTRAKQLRDWGIQGLITDYPKLMLQQL